MKLFGSSDIRHFVKKWITDNAVSLRGKKVLDIPAGRGEFTKLLQDVGANTYAYDLFPDFCQENGVKCEFADMAKQLPIEDNSADVILCQEGIEHLSDPLHILREFNRISKANSTLIITTPNYSNLVARFSYFLGEAERYKMPPPNELDSIWFSQSADQELKLYFGHVFLLGIQKLRLVAKIAGYQIKKVHHTKINHTSLILFPLCYPIILLANLLSYRRILKRHKNTPDETKYKIYKKILSYSINPKILLDKTLFIEFEKIPSPEQEWAQILPYCQPPA